MGEGAEKLCTEQKLPFLGRIPLDPGVVRACEKGVSVGKTDPKCPGYVAVDAIAQKLVDFLKL